MMKRMAAAAAATLAAACASMGGPATLAPLTLSPIWTLDGLANPESVLPSADGSFFYVSNVAGEGDGRDGVGFIARGSRDGRMIERDWATGFNAPKGMALIGDALFVTDIDRVLALDARTGAVRQTIAIEGAAFLNDAVAARGGGVLVSDSGAGRIHLIRDGAATVWLEHPLLRSINGLLTERDRLLVVTMQGRLVSVDWRSRAVMPLHEGLGAADGVVAWRDGHIVSEWRGRMFFVSGAGVQTVLDTRATPVFYNDFARVGDMLIVPHFEPGALTAYRIAGG